MASYIKNREGLRGLLKETKKFLSFRNFIRFIEKNNKDKKDFSILDVGFGAGDFLGYCISKFPESKVSGVDVNEKYFDYVFERFSSAKLSLYNGEDLPFQSDSIDVVTCIQVVEHMNRPEIFFKEAFRVLKKDGIAIVTTPNPTGLAAKILKESWQGIDPDEHISLKPPCEWRRIAKKEGFKVITDGTTLLSGFKLLRMFPFNILNGIILLFFGQFKWSYGESYNLFIRK